MTLRSLARSESVRLRCTAPATWRGSHCRAPTYANAREVGNAHSAARLHATRMRSAPRAPCPTVSGLRTHTRSPTVRPRPGAVCLPARLRRPPYIGPKTLPRIAAARRPCAPQQGATARIGIAELGVHPHVRSAPPIAARHAARSHRTLSTDSDSGEDFPLR